MSPITEGFRSIELKYARMLLCKSCWFRWIFIEQKIEIAFPYLIVSDYSYRLNRFSQSIVAECYFFSFFAYKGIYQCQYKLLINLSRNNACFYLVFVPFLYQYLWGTTILLLNVPVVFQISDTCISSYFNYKIYEIFFIKYCIICYFSIYKYY